MSKRRIKYTKGEYITAAIILLILALIQYLIILSFIALGAILIGTYRYLLYLKKIKFSG
ncbi:hypothetical protein [Neobacillus sp. PS3-40]|uniref:hypothetical protein n=1 Tax=Neobacillus sp. PS3-40 TaxID=3070679 RepID=UPI0027DF70A4|nr:hypothetical protein [Neobacillus sp. PS3-40]WML44508.1 hypothetical protein RCG20_00910 [Neobacillus sp. PS3-40]